MRTCSRCKATVKPTEVTQHTARLGLFNTGTTEHYVCSCGNRFDIVSDGRALTELVVSGFVLVGGLIVLGQGPASGQALKGLIGTVVGAVWFWSAVKNRNARVRNPPA